MSQSKNISELIHEYDQLLIRDLGFGDWKVWEPMINRIMNILGVYSFKRVILSEAHKNPGPQIVMYLVNSWVSEREGKYWGNLVSLNESLRVTPYKDEKVYKLHVKTRGELIETLFSETVFLDYDIICDLFDSEEYKVLKRLDGIETILSI